MADLGTAQKQSPCGGCGAPLFYVPSSDAEMRICEYCGMANAVVPEGLKGVSEVAPLVEMPSRFKVGQSGSIRGKTFQITGRARYDYGDGTWDEWTLYYPEENKCGWLTEDEGEWVLFEEKRPLEQALDLSSIKARQSLSLAGLNLFVHERGQCTPVGAEGQVFQVPNFGQAYAYVDGTAGDREVILMDVGGACWLAEGSELFPMDVKLETS